MPFRYQARRVFLASALAVALGTAIGIRPTLWIGFIGSWAAGFWVYFSPLRRMRDFPPSSPDSLSSSR